MMRRYTLLDALRFRFTLFISASATFLSAFPLMRISFRYAATFIPASMRYAQLCADIDFSFDELRCYAYAFRCRADAMPLILMLLPMLIAAAADAAATPLYGLRY